MAVLDREEVLSEVLLFVDRLLLNVQFLSAPSPHFSISLTTLFTTPTTPFFYQQTFSGFDVNGNELPA